MPDGYSFDKESAQRIQRVVLWAEKAMGWGGPGTATGGQILPIPWHYGKLDGALTPGSYVAFSIWTAPPATPTAFTDSGENIAKVYLPPWFTTGSLASGSWCQVAFHFASSTWRVVATPCDA
jgi:hypothetical protein